MAETHLDHFIVCDCSDMGHLVRVTYDRWEDDEEDFVLAVTMNNTRGFWRRVWMALKFVFRRDLDWHYDAVMMDKPKAQRLRNFINETILMEENVR